MPLEDFALDLPSPTPPTREAVPVKYLSMTSWFRPTASKIWAPQYEQRRDAHLGDDLEEALAYGLDVVLAGLLDAHALEQVGARHHLQRLESEVRLAVAP